MNSDIGIIRSIIAEFDLSEEQWQVLERIITILKSQPSEDCISRTELLAKIDAERKHLLDLKMDGAEHIVVHHARRIIEDMPSVSPQTRWIPCSERMPEVTDYYLIQYSRHICSDEMAVAFYSVEEAESDKNYTWEFKPFADCKEVIAWMPLPESYKEDEENEM